MSLIWESYANKIKFNYERDMAEGKYEYEKKNNKHIYRGLSLISTIAKDDYTAISSWTDC
jgi:tRNA(Ile2) C34 agmatinyltransferase TiaS